MNTILKTIFLLSFFVLSTISGKSQTSITTLYNGFTVDFTLPTYEILDTNIYEEFGIDQDYSYIEIEDFGEIIDSGYPVLPQYTINLHIPDDATTFTVTTSNMQTETEYLTYKIIPAQDYSEDEEDPDFVIMSDYYNSNGSLFAFTYEISDTFNVMGSRGISFSIFPFQYNPASDRIDVIESCTFTITHNGSSSIALRSASVSNSLTNVYKNALFDNYSTVTSTTADKGRYLIITGPDFEDDFVYFANYKRNIGYDVTVVTTDVTGTEASDIKNYIKGLYDNTATRPDFLLLAGDEIPYSATDPKTDLEYANQEDDFRADIFVGRLNLYDHDNGGEQQLHNFFYKTIYMETNLNYLTKNALLLSGSGDGEKRFHKSMQWVRDEILEPQNFDYNFYSGYNGDSEVEVANALSNNAYTLLVYRGHGYTEGIDGDGWDFSGYDLAQLFGYDVFPISFGFACKSFFSFFDYVGEVRGGVSYFGATININTYSNSKIVKKVMDEMDDREQLSPFINLGMSRFWSQSYAKTVTRRKKKREFIKAYNLIGDPSLFIRGIGCQEDYILTNNEVFPDGAKITYQASNDISTAESGATFVAESGSEVNLIAGNSITFNSGTAIEEGCEFSATIGSCSTTTATSYSAKMPTISDDTEEVLTRTEIVVDTTEYQQSFSNVITCFPNPVDDFINFYFYIASGKTEGISIYNTMGDKVLNYQLNLEANQWHSVNVNVSGLTKGTYIYFIKNTNGYEKGKFIKIN